MFKGYWGSKQIAHFKFDNPEKTGSDDPGMGWYYEPETDNRSDNASDKPSADDSKQRKQQELSMINAFLKSGQTPKPGSQIYSLMKKHGVVENFADGKNPGRKGLSRRVGIPKKATLGKLEKIAKSSTGERRRMAQWQLNMRRGKKK